MLRLSFLLAAAVIVAADGEGHTGQTPWKGENLHFGEWETNELARRLAEANRTEAAIAMLELNGEFYPASADIDVMIGELYRRTGERDKAVQRYRAALAKSPQHGMAKQRLEELEKKPQ